MTHAPYLDRVQQTFTLLDLHLAHVTLHLPHLHVTFSLSSDKDIWPKQSYIVTGSR